MELIDLVNSVIIFLSQTTLLRWLTFLLGSQSVNLTVLLFWIYLFLLMLVLVIQWFSLHWEILILLSRFSIDFPSNSQQDAPFHHITYDDSRADWGGLRDHLRDVPWEDIFKLRASAAASDFVSLFRLELMHISLIVSVMQTSLILMVFKCLCCCHSS